MILLVLRYFIYFCVLFVSFGDIQKMLKRRIAFFIIFGWILGDILDTAEHPWDTVWHHGGRRGPHLKVILMSVLHDVFRDPTAGSF